MSKTLRTAIVVALTALSLGPLAGCGHAKAHVEVAHAPAPAAPAPEPPEEETKPAPMATKLVLPGELEFDVNRATIKDTAQSREILETLASIMRDNPKITKLRIEGHTDSSGRPVKNLRLSQARAEAVAKWLTAHEIDGSRLAPVGLGPSRPLVDNATLEHRAVNRRTECHIQEVDGKAVTDEASITEQKGAVATSR